MIEIHRVGLVPYRETLELQRSFLRELIDGTGPERVILCQHPETLTLGTSFKESSLKNTRADIEQAGVEIVQVERGGDVTLHAPGQLVLYPIIDLRKRKTDIGWYMRSLEQVVIAAIEHLGIIGERSPKNPGVWVGEKKLASCGVKLSRWCTMHGIALNVSSSCLKNFSLIEPCGLTGVVMTCVEEECGRQPSISELETKFLYAFLDGFCTSTIAD